MYLSSTGNSVALVICAVFTLVNSVALSLDTSVEDTTTDVLATHQFQTETEIVSRVRALEDKVDKILDELSVIGNQVKKIEQKQAENETRRIHIRNIVRSLASGQFNVTKEILERHNDTTEIPEIVYQVVSNEKINNATSRILDFEKVLSNVNFSNTLLKSLWDEVRIVGSIEPNHLLSLLLQFESLPVDINDDTTFNRSVTIAEMERLLSDRTRDLFFNYIANVNSTPPEQLLSLSENFNNYSSEKLNVIIKSAVGKACTTVEAEDVFKQIAKLPYNTQVISGTNALFWEAKKSNQLTDQLAVDILNVLAAKKKPISQFNQSAVQDVLDNIPTCLRNLVYEPRVCIWNVATKEYLYGRHDVAYFHGGIIFTTKHLSSKWSVLMDNLKVGFIATPGDFHLGAWDSDSIFGIQYLQGFKSGVRSPQFTIQTHGEYCSIKSIDVDKFIYVPGIKWPKNQNYSFVFFGQNEDPSKDFKYLWQINKEQDCP